MPRVGASFVSLSIAFPPVLTYLGALALRIERYDAVRAAGVVAALAGAATLALVQLRMPNASPAWIGLTLVGPVLLAVGVGLVVRGGSRAARTTSDPRLAGDTGAARDPERS